MATTLLYKMAYPSLVAYTNIDHVLQELTPYMLHTNYVERTPVSVPLPVPFVPLPVQVQVPFVPLPVQVPVPVPVRHSVPFRPNSEDTLFWCVYVAKHGIQEYLEIPTNRYKNREIEEKQKIAAHFHTSPATRPAKMSMVLLKELLGEISTDRRMTLRTLPLWCIFYELSCVHVLNTSNKTYLTYSTEAYTSFPASSPKGTGLRPPFRDPLGSNTKYAPVSTASHIDANSTFGSKKRPNTKSSSTDADGFIKVDRNHRKKTIVVV